MNQFEMLPNAVWLFRSKSPEPWIFLFQSIMKFNTRCPLCRIITFVIGFIKSRIYFFKRAGIAKINISKIVVNLMLMIRSIIAMGYSFTGNVVSSFDFFFHNKLAIEQMKCLAYLVGLARGPAPTFG